MKWRTAPQAWRRLVEKCTYICDLYVDKYIPKRISLYLMDAFFILTFSWRRSWPTRTLWSGLGQIWWTTWRWGWGCRGSKWRRSTTWRRSWSAWAWQMPLICQAATSLVGLLFRSLVCKIIQYVCLNRNLFSSLSPHRHVTRKRPVPFTSGPQGLCGCQRGGNRSRRCHGCNHGPALRSDAPRRFHRRSPLPLLHPSQPLQEHPIRRKILLSAVKEVLGYYPLKCKNTHSCVCKRVIHTARKMLNSPVGCSSSAFKTKLMLGSLCGFLPALVSLASWAFVFCTF